jgi:hypothetical protein
MHVNDCGHGRLLPQVVVRIETEANAHEDPEKSKPDQRSPAIFARRPGCSSMDMHPGCPPLSFRETYRNGMDVMGSILA